MKPEATGLVLVNKLPAGEAPLEIRTAWIGVSLPCDPIMGYPDDNSERDVMSKASIRPRIGVSVPQDLALEVLDRERPEAALWWRQRGFPHANEYFGFAEDEITIVRGVTRQRLLCWNDGEGGPYR